MDASLPPRYTCDKSRLVFCLVDFVNILFSFSELFNPSWELVYPLSLHMGALHSTLKDGYKSG